LVTSRAGTAVENMVLKER